MDEICEVYFVQRLCAFLEPVECFHEPPLRVVIVIDNLLFFAHVYQEFLFTLDNNGSQFLIDIQSEEILALGSQNVIELFLHFARLCQARIQSLD